MIVFDTEATCLLKPDTAPLPDQPHLVDFAGIRLNNKTLKEEFRLQLYVNPGIPLPEEFVKITGYTQEMVDEYPSLQSQFPSLAEFFLGETIMAGHNLEYDRSVLMYSFIRIGKLCSFPWPRRHICTVESSRGIRGHNLGLSDLYLLAKGKDIKDKKERQEFRVGQMVKHKSLGLCVVDEVLLTGKAPRMKVTVQGSKQQKTLQMDKFKLNQAFEGAHGAMKDAEETAEVVRWLVKENWISR